MGIKGLTKLLADKAPNAMTEQKFESYSGRKIAIDASMSIYQFLIVVGRNGTEMLTNESGEVTSHLQGMFARTIRLLEAGLKPVYVFDGKPPHLKKQELAKRHSKRADATEDLNKALVVYAVASEDMDSLTFGAPRFLRHLMDPSSKKVPVMEFEVSKVLEELNLTMDQFIDLCILSGCDYCDSIRGIGGQTALKLIWQHGSIEHILENINKERYLIPDNWPYQEARCLFNEPLVFVDDERFEIKWSAPDEEGLITFLVNENGFKSDRIIKAIEKIRAAKNKSTRGRLESFFKPVVSTAVPIKQKESKCVLGSPKPIIKPKMFSVQACTDSGPKVVGNFSLPTLALGSTHSTLLSRGVCFGT
ncbi:flap endonuclease 1-like isoform X3 [Camellia sinensis]|uniref:flap endonuclease 1-like isoform X3 n=1 Tax=Camellia sinensis TaxID=4442 RepID=UPI0010360EE1|nr:flap endonuclease 1-like isoform X3 [Camellia sinensis]